MRHAITSYANMVVTVRGSIFAAIAAILGLGCDADVSASPPRVPIVVRGPAENAPSSEPATVVEHANAAVA
jgi:hypothetical protein